MKAIKFELYRAFVSKKYLIALILGCVISVAQFVTRVLPYYGNVGTDQNMLYPQSLYNTCLMMDASGFYNNLYYYAIIIIAVIPFGTSYYTDRKEGYKKNIYIRISHMNYVIAKYIAIFLSAMTICIIPLVLNIYLSSLVVPAVIPQVGTHLFSIFFGSMLCSLFYTRPMIYLLIYLVIDGVMAGLFACVIFCFCGFCANKYMALFIPFLTFILMESVMSFLYYSSSSPYAVMNHAQTVWQTGSVVILEIIILFVVTFGGCILGGMKKDAL